MMSKSNGSSNQKDLFKTKIVPAKPGSGKLFEEEFVTDKRPVECLGMSFPADEDRRKHFLGILQEKLKDPEFRKIEGFPIGSDEDILALSDPPYYTACPNPFLSTFLVHASKGEKSLEGYHRSSYALNHLQAFKFVSFV